MNTTLRKAIKDIDRRFFAGTLRKLNRHRWKYQSYWLRKPLINYILQKKYIDKMHAVFKYNNYLYLTDIKKDNLGSLLDKYGSDKGYNLHTTNSYQIPGSNYNNIYSLLFFQHKNKTKLVLECGIGTKNPNITKSVFYRNHVKPGSSLKAWRDYFPNAEIIGIDIDPDVIFTENRINTYVCDQTSKQSITNFISQAELKHNTVDIIIDDGLHKFDANVTLFENTRHLLKDNGIYVIEDFWVINKKQQLFIDYFNKLSDYHVKFIKFLNAYLIVITKNTTNYFNN